MTAENSTTATEAGWNFDNSYVQLPESLYARLNPVPVREPRLVVFNRLLAESLGLRPEALAGDEGAAIFAGNRIPAGAEPIAQAYAGHQFGSFTILGDGRAILLGEQITPGGERFDIQLKGSGRTPFSRRGDGRAALGPMLREYIISEAMHALGIPTTRSLAVVTTGEQVFRETPLPGAILTRVAASHIRVGTFEFLAAKGDLESIRALADYTISRHFPDLNGTENRFLALLYRVMERQAALVTKWLEVGFIHGVMNTDNMSLCGETIDYGPCAFLDTYDPATVFSSIDQSGRYAYGNQSQIVQWNLTRFAETLLPLLHEEQDQAIRLAQEAVSAFPEIFLRCRLAGIRAKLGLFTEESADLELIKELLNCMQQNHADYTNTFRDLAAETVAETALFRDAAFLKWQRRWQERLTRQPQSVEESRTLMRAQNPAVIPRNHRVEEALEAAVERGDFTVMAKLLEVLSQPYAERAEDDDYRSPPEPSARCYQTFCGT
ncbi:MAG: YdiU family protein [Deltaproteobacteria bacterium]|nr:YdiU family protein [Deltaproteobacteria bacterium]TLN03367.1 MAG: YdiU family protein [bacterium]